MPELRIIDHLSSNGKSLLHRAGVAQKLAMTAVLIALAITAESVLFFAFFIPALVALGIASGLPMKKFVRWLAYPVFFAVFFAISAYAAGNFALAQLSILRPVSVALLMLLLVSTTPVFSIFALLSRFMGKSLTNILYVTYRYFFLISDRLDGMLTAIRVRGGYSGFARRPENAGKVMGSLLLHSVDLAERLQEVLEVRGFRGALAPARARESEFAGNLFVAVATIVLVAVYFVA